MNPITLQIISNAIVLLGVLVAIGTIILQCAYRKKLKQYNFFESQARYAIYRVIAYPETNVHRSGNHHFRSYVFPCDGCNNNR